MNLKAKLKYSHGMTLEEYNLLKRTQKGLCAICGRKDRDRRLTVDHDHGSQKKRGLLCNKCNRALGLFRDDLEILKKAVLYLEKYKM